MNIHISDQETDALVRSLAKGCSISVTQAINMAVGEALDKRGIARPHRPEAKGRGKAALLKALDVRLRSDTLKYTRLRNQVLGTKGGGSRIYKMLTDHGPVEAMRRVVSKRSDGLEFLAKNEALEIATETAALDPQFESIIPEDIRILARANLAVVEARGKK